MVRVRDDLAVRAGAARVGWVAVLGDEGVEDGLVGVDLAVGDHRDVGHARRRRAEREGLVGRRLVRRDDREARVAQRPLGAVGAPAAEELAAAVRPAVVQPLARCADHAGLAAVKRLRLAPLQRRDEAAVAYLLLQRRRTA